MAYVGWCVGAALKVTLVHVLVPTLRPQWWTVGLRGGLGVSASARWGQATSVDNMSSSLKKPDRYFQTRTRSRPSVKNAAGVMCARCECIVLGVTVCVLVCVNLMNVLGLECVRALCWKSAA